MLRSVKAVTLACGLASAALCTHAQANAVTVSARGETVTVPASMIEKVVVWEDKPFGIRARVVVFLKNDSQLLKFYQRQSGSEFEIAVCGDKTTSQATRMGEGAKRVGQIQVGKWPTPRAKQIGRMIETGNCEAK